VYQTKPLEITFETVTNMLNILLCPPPISLKKKKRDSFTISIKQDTLCENNMPLKEKQMK